MSLVVLCKYVVRSSRARRGFERGPERSCLFVFRPLNGEQKIVNLCVLCGFAVINKNFKPKGLFYDIRLQHQRIC
jgi:hypothetical protein